MQPTFVFQKLFRKRSLLLAIILALAHGNFTAHAADADDADDAGTNHERRPIEELFKTDNVFPQDKGELEVELASAYQNHSGEDTWSLPVSLEYGLTDQLQVEAEWDGLVSKYPRNQPVARGIGDLELGTQYSFLNVGGSLFHIAPRFSVELPLGDVNNDISDGFVEYQPAVVIARDFPEWHRTEIFGEIGASFVQRVKRPSDADDAESASHELDLGTGFFTLFAHGAATMEINWDNNQWNHHGTENDLYVTPGYIWKVMRELELGIGVPIGLNRKSDRFDIDAHAVYEF
jgi:hypothetical protein